MRRVLLSLIVLLVLGVLVGPFLVPVPPLENTVDPEQLADADSRFIDVDAVRVHYREAGNGEPAFVLLHGFGASVFSWREVFESFAELGHTVAYDRPAFGLTSRPRTWIGMNPYADAAQPDIALALLDALRIERAVWIANSAGARVAVGVALRHPERVHALVLVDPAVGGPPSWLRVVLRTPQLAHLGPRLVRGIADRGDDVIRRAWHDPSRVTPEILTGYRQPLRANDWDYALWQFTAAERDPQLADRITELGRVPTLVITGDDDRIVPTQHTLELAARIPRAERVVLPDCGHVPQEECPAAFMRAVREFLAKL